MQAQEETQDFLSNKKGKIECENGLLSVDPKNLQIGIIIGIIFTILVTYFILPHITKSKIIKYYGITDIYEAIYFGLIISAVELVLLFFAILFFTK